MHQIRGIAIAAAMLIASCVAQAQWSWQGTWSSGTAYTANQVVSYMGSSYLCLVGNTAVPPPTNGTDWALVAQAGAAGTPGVAASVSVGSTYQGPPLSYPSVTNSGSGSAAVLNFTIPQSWGGGYVASINGATGALTFSGSCFSLTGTAATITCPFSGLTSGTNTTAAMLVGSGSSLGTTGTGTVSANEINSVPFCTGAVPANGSLVEYTTGGSPNPCYSFSTASNACSSYVSTTSSGCTVLPDGKWLQWVTGATQSANFTGAITVSLPVTFPNGCYTAWFVTSLLGSTISHDGQGYNNYANTCSTTTVTIEMETGADGVGQYSHAAIAYVVGN